MIEVYRHVIDLLRDFFKAGPVNRNLCGTDV